ncbi:MAG TPA: M23 family metallopeptidase [Bordetella sp.]|nr:M23 family metallopeptidase [Bordetella sp.]
MHARRGSTGHFTLEGSRLAMLMSGVLLFAALFGALIYRGMAPGAVLPATPAGTAPQEPQAAYSDDTLHRTLALLAEKVGTLQARLAGVDALSRRLAIAAGVPLPETFAAAIASPPPGSEAAGSQSAEAMDGASNADAAEADPTEAEIDRPGPAQTLGRDIDVLSDELSGRLAALQVFDMALTRRRADLARLPSSMPVTDYPYLSSSYGWRRHPVTGRYTLHDGLDFAAPRGTPILAAAAGVVLAAGPDAGYGKRVDIDHGDGLISRYAHASRVLVNAGDLVERGQLIARVGSSGVSTGPHLHFEIRLAGQALDPRLFLGRLATAPPALASATMSVVR